MSLLRRASPIRGATPYTYLIIPQKVEHFDMLSWLFKVTGLCSLLRVTSLEGERIIFKLGKSYVPWPLYVLLAYPRVNFYHSKRESIAALCLRHYGAVTQLKCHLSLCARALHGLLLPIFFLLTWSHSIGLTQKFPTVGVLKKGLYYWQEFSACSATFWTTLVLLALLPDWTCGRF